MFLFVAAFAGAAMTYCHRTVFLGESTAGVYAIALFILVASGIASFSRQRAISTFGVMLGVFWVGAVTASVDIYGALQRRKALPLHGTFVGQVTDESTTAHGVRIRVEANAVGTASEMAGVPIELWLELRDALANEAVSVGDKVRFRGRVKGPAPATMPGDFDAEAYFWSQKIDGRTIISRRSDFAITERSTRMTRMSSTRKAIQDRIRDLVEPRKASILLALMLGDTTGFDDKQHQLYRRVGAGHLLAVSGMQVSLLAALFYSGTLAVVRRQKFFQQRNSARRCAASVSIIGVWFFVFLCRAPPSCVRAGAMTSLVLLSVFLGRRDRVMNIIGATGLATVLMKPSSVVEPGFILSYLALATLVLAAKVQPRLSSRLLERMFQILFSALSVGATTTVAAWSLFVELCAASLNANTVIVPIAGLLQLPAIVGGFVAATFSWSWLAELAAACGGLLEAVVDGVGRDIGGVTLHMPLSGFTALLVAMTMLLTLVLLPRWRKVWVAMLLAWLTSTGMFLLDTQRPKDAVEFLPVGQGDSVLVSSADGRHLLVDAGGSYDERYDPGQRLVLPYLERRGIDKLDVVILSHPDPDHLLGLLAVLEQCEVAELWHPGFDPSHPLMQRLIASTRRAGVKRVVASALPATVRFGSLAIDVIAPRPSDGSSRYEELSTNDNSIVVRVRGRSGSVLLTGDIESLAEEILLDAEVDLRADVVKAPHHGSRTSSTQRFVEATGARHVVFTTGPGNKFGFPHQDVVERWKRVGAEVWDTAVHGKVRILLDRGIEVDSFVQARAAAHFDSN